MTQKLIATKIVEKKLSEFKTSCGRLEKTAYGGASAMVSAPPNPTGKPPTPVFKPPEPTPRANLWPTKPPDSVPLAFLYGAGQGLGNQLDAMGNFAKGTVRGGVAGLAAQVARPFAPEYAADLDRQAEAGGWDILNSFGQFVGLYKAWDPSTGAYRGAQQPDALKQHDKYIEKKYFDGDASKSDLGRAWTGVNNVADSASEAIPLAATGEGLIAGASKLPAVAQIGEATPPIVKQVLTYGAGIPAQQNVKTIPFLASQLGQAYARSEGLPYSEYLPGPAIDSAARETFGPWAPEVLDGALGQRSGIILDTINAGWSPQELHLQEKEDLASSQQQPQQNDGADAPQIGFQDNNTAQPDATGNKPVAPSPDSDRAANLGLPADTSPEVVDQTAQAQAQVGQHPQAQAAISNPNGEEANQLREQGQPIHATHTAATYTEQNPPPKNPQDWAEWFRGMTDHITNTWQSMDPLSQLAVGLGVPIGIVGLLSGNIGGFLLGAIGLGVGGMAAAQGGMFNSAVAGNSTAQSGAQSNQTATPEDTAVAENLNTNSANLTASNNGAAIQTPPKQKIDSAVQTLAFSNNPILDVQKPEHKEVFEYIGNLAKNSPEDLQRQFSAFPANVQTGLTQNVQKILKDVGPGTLKYGLLSDEQKTQIAALQQVMSIIAAPSIKKSNENYIQNNLIPKIARCWKGYEPVPGTKPYTEGSCRPKGSKKTKKQMKKKSSDYFADISFEKPAILTLIRGYYGQPTSSQSIKVRT